MHAKQLTFLVSSFSYSNSNLRVLYLVCISKSSAIRLLCFHNPWLDMDNHIGLGIFCLIPKKLH